MARQVIDIETDHGTYKGDPAKVAFTKTNDNFQELYGLTAAFAQLAGKNYLINPQMNINQRNFAGGALAANVYGFDRWKGGAGGCNISVNQTTAVITHTSGTYQQIIEAPGLAGKTVTLSVENPSGALNVNVGGVSATITAGAGRRGQQFAIPAGATGNITVAISATNVTYARPQLELGSTPTPFEYRPVALEMALCRRYGQAGFLFSRGAVSVATGVSSHITVAMRAAPAVTFNSVNYIYGCSDIGANSNLAGVDIFVSATGAFAYGAGYFLDSEL